MAESVVLSAFILLVAAILVFLAATFLFVTLYIAYVHHIYNHLPGPPYHSFYMGHVSDMRKCTRRNEYYGFQMAKWANEYSPAFRTFMFHQCIIWVTDPTIVKEEILTKTEYIKSTVTYPRLAYVCGKRFLGHGLLNETDHSLWHKRRVIVNPAFHRRYLRLFLDQFNHVGDRWISALDNLADGKTMLNMHDYMCRITLDAIAEIGFSDCLNAIECMDNRFFVAILDCLQAISQKVKNPFFEYMPTERSFRKKVAESVEFLRGHGQKLLHARLAQMKAGENVPDDMMTYIINCKDADPSLTDEDLLDDFMTLFLAGQETTSNALSFMFCEVGRHPEVLLKLQAEVDSVMGSRNYVEYEDLGKLKYCSQVFKETLRLYPPAPGTLRENTEDVMLGDLRVPAHTMIACSFFSLHRLDKYYEQPHEFHPERFASTAERTLLTYMPFSIGQRACIGRQFANIEAKVLMCKFFRTFCFKLDPDQPFGIMETATLRPKSSVRMTLTPRST